MSYLDIPVPNRSEHLWRYTSWKRVHPTKVESLPNIETSKVTINGEQIKSTTAKKILSNDEISRAFLTESNPQQHIVVLDEDMDALHIEVSCEAEISSCNLYFEANSSGSIILHITGVTNWFGLSITGMVQQNVNLSFAIVNDLSEGSTMLRAEDWTVARDSTLEYGELSTGGSRIKSDIRTYLKGSNATLIQNIAVNCQTTRVDDHHIEIHHQSGHSNSSLTVKSACSERGHAIGTGLLSIDEDCDKTDAGQVFKNLLLSPQAKAESIPELEVLSDDVSAAHGAASSSVDAEQIHYMMARGFTPNEAQAVIVEGFLVSSFAKMHNETTRQFLLEALSNQTGE
ncbi:MAG TPA: hypothetical protein HA354_01005 [Candidatus Poseidoniaceae archaeon]|nr:MAG TPA: hypothetical protein D7I07_00995 [Candidatus Poseidoniales archaeon]HII37059.1 hypothetical protein [Candidatus Poseidoniaceae archaeon]|tara:strand:- start:2321 stop:3349 length:1029 start_codon:yes stop_codon:yes gene_type:complete